MISTIEYPKYFSIAQSALVLSKIAYLQSLLMSFTFAGGLRKIRR